MTIVLFIGASASVAAPLRVSAHSNGGNATGGGQWHPWPSDGCTKALNWTPKVFNFTHACQHHDGCYVWRFSNDKNTCDRWFLNDMIASCGNRQDTWLINYLTCRNIANAYYIAVWKCGNYSWNNRSVSTPLGDLPKSCVS